MRCVCNDYPVRDDGAGDGTDARLWLGDRYECPGCGSGVVVGFGEGRQASACPPAELAVCYGFSWRAGRWFPLPPREG